MSDLPASVILTQCRAWVKDVVEFPLIFRSRVPLQAQLAFDARLRRLVAPRAPEADAELLRRLHKAAGVRSAARHVPFHANHTIASVDRPQVAAAGRIKRSVVVPRRPAGKRGLVLEASELFAMPERVSKSGRRTKTPSKFKHIEPQPYRRMFGQDSITGSNRPSVASAASRGRKGVDDTPPRLIITESRIGAEYQAEIPPVQTQTLPAAAPASAPSVPDRPDRLVWSPAENPFDPLTLDVFLGQTTPLLGVAPEGGMNRRAVLPEFPAEVVLRVLRECGFDIDMCRQELQRIGREQTGLWTKTEERHFKSALAKSKKDLRQVQEAVRTKDLGAVVRFYYLDNGLHKKEERDKEQELAVMREARARDTAAARLAAVGGRSAGGSATATECGDVDMDVAEEEEEIEDEPPVYSGRLNGDRQGEEEVRSTGTTSSSAGAESTFNFEQGPYVILDTIELGERAQG